MGFLLGFLPYLLLKRKILIEKEMKIKDWFDYINQKIDRIFFDKVLFFYEYFYDKFKLEEKRKAGKWYAMSYYDWKEKWDKDKNKRISK